MEDVPLLDEAAELLGVPLGRAQRAARRRAGRRRRGARFARAVLEGLRLDMPIDPELLAERYAGEETVLSVAERARVDRTWEFGHVIVDEAQELSPMAWRVLFRRCPSKSMTVVGDLAQTGASWGPASWAELFDRHAPNRWRRAELTVNYRTPAEIMEVAIGRAGQRRPRGRPAPLDAGGGRGAVGGVDHARRRWSAWWPTPCAGSWPRSATGAWP